MRTEKPTKRHTCCLHCHCHRLYKALATGNTVLVASQGFSQVSDTSQPCGHERRGDIRRKGTGLFVTAAAYGNSRESGRNGVRTFSVYSMNML